MVLVRCVEFPDLPIIVYNVPVRAAVDITPETVGRLRRGHDNIVGIKETTRDFEHVSYVLNEAGTDFIALSGHRAALLPDALPRRRGHLAASGTSRRDRWPSSTTRSSPATTSGPAPCTTTCTRWSMRPSPRRTPCRRSGSWSSSACSSRPGPRAACPAQRRRRKRVAELLERSPHVELPAAVS